MIKPLRLYTLDIVADNPSAFSPSIEAAERRGCNRSWHAKSQRQEQEAAISLEIATPDRPALSNVSILFMKPRTSGGKIACPNQESCLLSCLARVGFFQAITPHKSQPLKNLINLLQLFFPTPLYISTQSGNIVVTISPFVSGRRHSLTPVLEMTKKRGVACNGICPPFRDGSPSFSPSSSYDDSAPCHLNSSNCPKDQKFVALQHCENEDSAAKAAPSACSRNMSANINTCSSEAL